MAADSGATKDNSPHRIQFVTIAPEVKLEVLDWGGSGEVVVFLSGLGDTAHAYDDFAPALADKLHVYGITRRGFGDSSKPATGYDIATRGEDLLHVLDALHLKRVSLVGHSIAGDELTWFAGKYPDRVARLVYLDAAYDHSPVMALKSHHWPLPEPWPDIWWQVLEGCGHPDYPKVKAPALAINMASPSADNYYLPEVWGSWDVETREKMRAAFDVIQPMFDSKMEFSKTKDGRTIEIKHTSHYLYISSRDEVLRHTREFLIGGR